jgi:hypothetical protein
MNVLIRFASALLISIVLSGCATVQKGFVGEEHENVAPFAEATIQFLGAKAVDFRSNELIYLRQYLNEGDQDIEKLRQLLQRVDNFRNEIVYYSVELVRVSESSSDGSGKARDLAQTLNGRFRTQILGNTDMTATEYDELIAAVASEEEFLSALRAVQPLIAKSGDAYEDLIREIEEKAIPAARRFLDAKIENEFAVEIAQLGVVYSRRDELMTGLQHINAYRLGDKDATKSLGSSGIIFNSDYFLPASPSNKQLEKTKDHLISELKKEHKILELMQDDVDSYFAAHAELDREMSEIDDGLSVARRQVIAWIRGHQGLADGVRDPGKWLKAIFQVAEGVRKVG